MPDEHHSDLFEGVLEDELQSPAPGTARRLGGSSLRADEFAAARQREEDAIVDREQMLRMEEAALRTHERRRQPTRRTSWTGVLWIVAGGLSLLLAGAGVALWEHERARDAETQLQAANAARRAADEERLMNLSHPRPPAPQPAKPVGR